jgi:HK97 family phage major capsid protein
MAEVTTKEVMEAVSGLRENLEKYGQESMEYKSAYEKTLKTIEDQEKKSAEILAGQKAAEKSAAELIERVKALEIDLATKSAISGGPNYKESAEYKALRKFAMVGESKMTPDEVKTMRMDDNTAGGYLTTTEMDNVIIKTITEISPVRQVSRVKTVSKKTLEVPKRTGILVATYEGEAQDGDESQSAYGNEQVTAFRQTVTVPYTQDLLMDSVFDLESEINGDVGEAFAKGEGTNFVLGDGAKKPEGFLVNADVVAGAVETAGSGTISGDDLLLLTGQLKVGYNPMYGFNRQTLAFLRTLKGSDDQYLWQIGLAPGAPNTIAGEPYVVMQDMPSIATGALSVIYADFLRGYLIIDRTGMLIIRDEFTGKKAAIIELTFHRWNTGQVVLSEAFQALKIKA